MSRVTQDTAMLHFASHTGLSPSMVTFSKDGKVTAICVKPGQAVLEEDALVVIE